MIRYRETVFIDTSAFVGLIVQTDFLHKSAILVMAELVEMKCRLVTTEAVLFEMANGFSATRFRNDTADFINKILQNNDVDVEWSSRTLFDDAFELYRTRPDKDWSLTDCASFVLMKERNIKLAFTSDKHFEQAGFVKLIEM